MTQNNFKKTGRSVEVNKNDLINDAIEQLKNYDSMPSENKYKMPNPYTEPINTKSNNGTLIEIPQYIQNIAIDKWNKNKNNDPHTRLSRRLRTRNIEKDPFILNKEISDIDVSCSYNDISINDKNIIRDFDLFSVDQEQSLENDNADINDVKEIVGVESDILVDDNLKEAEQELEQEQDLEQNNQDYIYNEYDNSCKDCATYYNEEENENNKSCDPAEEIEHFDSFDIDNSTYRYLFYFILFAIICYLLVNKNK